MMMMIRDVTSRAIHSNIKHVVLSTFIQRLLYLQVAPGIILGARGSKLN